MSEFFGIEKLPFKFDIEKLQEELFNLIVPLGDPIIPGGDYGRKFGGWSVQSASGDWKDGWISRNFQRIIQRQLKKNKFEEMVKLSKKLGIHDDIKHVNPTQACGPYFTEVINTLEDAGLMPRRGRISMLEPYAESSRHKDSSPETYAARIHIPLQTYPECIHSIWDDNDNRVDHHLPADGSVYMMFVNNHHQIFNPTEHQRYHFICSAWDTKHITENFKYDNIEFLEKRMNS